MTQTQLCAVHIALLQLLEKLGAMEPQSTKQVLDNLIRLAVDAGKRSLDGTSQVLVSDTEDDPLLLASLGKIDFEERFQVVAGNPLGDVVRIFKCLGCASNCFSQLRQWRGNKTKTEQWGRQDLLKRCKGDKPNNFSEPRQILSCFLNLFKTVANCLWLQHDLEKAVPNRSLLQEIVDGSHSVLIPVSGGADWWNFWWNFAGCWWVGLSLWDCR